MNTPSDNRSASASRNPALKLPLWVYSDRTPRPVRVTGGICRVWAYFALFAAVAHVLRVEAISADPRDPMMLLRLGGTAVLCLVASMPRRHIAWHIGRWVLPLVYTVILFRSQWLLLLPMLVLLLPYIRNQMKTGVRSWHQPATTIAAALDRPTP